jgi:hypothetical protein
MLATSWELSVCAGAGHLFVSHRLSIGQGVTQVVSYPSSFVGLSSSYLLRSNDLFVLDKQMSYVCVCVDIHSHSVHRVAKYTCRVNAVTMTIQIFAKYEYFPGKTVVETVLTVGCWYIPPL